MPWGPLPAFLQHLVTSPQLQLDRVFNRLTRTIIPYIHRQISCIPCLASNPGFRAWSAISQGLPPRRPSSTALTIIRFRRLSFCLVRRLLSLVYVKGVLCSHERARYIMRGFCANHCLIHKLYRLKRFTISRPTIRSSAGLIASLLTAPEVWRST